jgi:hypothetical protein
MQSIKIIHVGDIHFPDRKDALLVDLKDEGMSGKWVSGLVPDPFKKTSDEIRLLLLTDPLIKAVLISGDLTTAGKISGYKECVDFLSTALEFSNGHIWDDKVLRVVPGNHDVVRADVDLSGVDLLKKLTQPKAIWDAVMPGAFDPANVSESDISLSGKKLVRIHALNTCVGCGEKRFLPKAVREKLHEAIEAFVHSASGADGFNLVGEQLDTPAVLEAQIESLERSISQVGQSVVSMVLGHHSVLPQALLRIDLYTELINGGRFRSAMASLEANVVYCHGHIHNDPIEVIELPAVQRGKLISISAPLFSDGFNVIELVFTDGGEPIGCAIHPYRRELYGSVRRRDAIRVKLQPANHNETLCGDEAMQILQALGKSTLRFGDLKEKIAEKIHIQLESIISFLEWLNLVEVRNREDSCVHWHIRRIGP